MRTPDAADRDERIRALVDCPVPLSGLLSGRLDVAAPALRQLVLEVLTRRYYRIRPLEEVKSLEVDGHSILSADYAFEGRQIRFDWPSRRSGLCSSSWRRRQTACRGRRHMASRNGRRPRHRFPGRWRRE